MPTNIERRINDRSWTTRPALTSSQLVALAEFNHAQRLLVLQRKGPSNIEYVEIAFCVAMLALICAMALL